MNDPYPLRVEHPSVPSCNTMSVCQPLKGSEQCHPWAENFMYNSSAIVEGLLHSPTGKINGHDITSPASVQDFDTFVQLFSWGNSDISRNHFKKLFRCKNWDGTGLRYATTYNCLYGVYTASGTCNRDVPRLGLCHGTCTDFIQSLESIFSNEKFCSQSADDLLQRQRALDAYRSGCVVDTSINCVAGNRKDLQTCGFGSSSDQIKQASLFCDANPTKPCCTAFSSYKRDLDRKQSEPQGSGSQAGEGLSWWEWGLVALGVIVLVVIPLYLFVRYKKRKHERNSYETHPMPPPALKVDTNGYKSPEMGNIVIPSAPPRDHSQSDTHRGVSVKQRLSMGGHQRGSNRTSKYNDVDDGDDDTDFLLTSPMASSISSSSLSSIALPRPGDLTIPTSQLLSNALLSSTHQKPSREKVRFRDTLQFMEPSEHSDFPSVSTISQIAGHNGNSAAYSSAPRPRSNGCTHPMLVNSPVSSVRPLCVLFGYEPQLPDEIQVVPGDMAIINSTYPEGWSNVTNISTGQTGMTPTACFGSKINL